MTASPRTNNRGTIANYRDVFAPTVANPRQRQTPWLGDQLVCKALPLSLYTGGGAAVAASPRTNNRGTVPQLPWQRIAPTVRGRVDRGPTTVATYSAHRGECRQRPTPWLGDQLWRPALPLSLCKGEELGCPRCCEQPTVGVSLSMGVYVLSSSPSFLLQDACLGKAHPSSSQESTGSFLKA